MSQSQLAAQEFVFDLDGGRLPLDFVNTLSSSSGEHLNDYGDLIAFARQSQVITQAEAETLQRRASKTPRQAHQVYVRSLRLRSALQGIFSAIALGETVPQADLKVLNGELAFSLGHAQVAPRDGGFVWTWADEDQLERLIWPIARAAAELLVSDTERELVRECGASDCKWLFVDTSKNRTRQWCSMSSCGNREKARRHYLKVKARQEISAG